MTKRKKFWLTFSIICTCIVCVLVIFSLAFRLKTVDVEIRARAVGSQSKLPDGIINKVLASGEFKTGKNILFYNTADNVKKIEKANPYVKVEQVIKYFPNKLRVYISERTMKYRVQDTQEEFWYILDEDFKVLEIVNFDYISDYVDKTFEISNKNLNISSKVGDFVDNNQIKVLAMQIAEGIYGRTKDIGKVSLVEMNFSGETFSAEIRMKYRNVLIKVIGNDDLAIKVFRAVSAIYDDQMQEIDIAEGTVITVKKDFNGEIVVIK